MKFETSKRFCNEDISLVENYKEAINDDSCRWVIHHRLETHTSDGQKRLIGLSMAELKALDMYYDRPADELIFMKTSTHVKLHREVDRGNTGKHWKNGNMSEEHKNRISEAQKKRWSKIKNA